MTSTLAGSRVGGPPIGLRRRGGSGVDVPRAGPVGFGVDPAFAASASVPPGLPCAGAVDPSTALSVGRGAVPLDPKTEGQAGRFRRSVAERLNTAPFLAGKAKLQGLHPPTSLVDSHPRVRRWNLPFLPWAFFPLRGPLFPRLERCRARVIPPPVRPPVAPSVRASVPEDLLRNPRAAGVAPLRSLSGERATAASVRPKPAGRLRWPPWGF